MRAPNFSLLDQNGVTHSLDEYAGSWVVLYFYPKDDTPGCAKEACSFQRDLTVFTDMGVVVLGMSKDSATSHTKFAQKYGLEFPLLSDPSKTTIQAYGAWGVKKFMGKEFEGVLRQTAIINPQGEIVKRYEDVDPIVHSEQVAKDLQDLM